MLSYQHLLFSLFVTHLLPCSLASAIPDGPDVGSTPAPELSDRSTPTILPLGRRDEGFVEWLNAQTSDRNSGVSQRLRRNIEIEPTANPAVDGSEAAGSLGLSSRDTEANSLPDAAADGGRSPNGPGIFPRGDGPYAETSFDKVAKNMKTLNTDDQKCGARAVSAPPLTSSSPGIKKRVPNPSNCLWNAGLAACVDRGASNCLPWAGSLPAIGTRGLCGCSAVAIVSQVGVIVSHISPNVGTIDDQLAQLLRLYNQFIRPQTQAYAWFFPPMAPNGAIQVPPFQDYIHQYIQSSLHLVANVIPYVADPHGTSGHEGTVAAKKIAGAIVLYLNDQRINWAHSQRTI